MASDETDAERRRAAVESFRALREEMAARSDLDEEAAMRLAVEAVKEVRRERAEQGE